MEVLEQEQKITINDQNYNAIKPGDFNEMWRWHNAGDLLN